jgi:hypothetical protein
LRRRFELRARLDFLVRRDLRLGELLEFSSSGRAAVAAISFVGGSGGSLGARGGVLRGARLPFALLFGGLDELGVGAHFDVGILQGREGEAIVAKFSKTSHIFFSWLNVALAKQKNSWTEGWARAKAGGQMYRRGTGLKRARRDDLGV